MFAKTAKVAVVALRLVFFALFLFLPVFTVVEQGCKLPLFREVFRNALYVQGLFNSLCIALVTTFLVLLISLPRALFYDRYDFPG